MVDKIKTCGYDKCDRGQYDDEFCIFHSNSKKNNKEFFHLFYEEFKDIKGPLDFTGFVFPDHFDFFKLPLNYVGCNFEKALLINGRFGFLDLSGANFFKATVSRAEFGKAKLKGVYFTEAILDHIYMDGTDAEAAIFCGATIRDCNIRRSNLQNARFDGADFECINNPHSSFTENDIRGADLREANLNKMDLSGIKYNKRSLYAGINLNDCFGAPMFVQFARDQEYLEEYKEINPKLYFLWWLFADCGRSLTRWAVWSIVLAALFALVFIPAPDFFPDWWIELCNIIGPRFEQTAQAYQGKPLDFWSSLYFSIVTFTTLGFGDVVTANTTARILVTIEVILGYIMLGGLISIFSNKLARRS